MDTKEYTKPQGKFLKAEFVIKNPDMLWEITAEGIFQVSERYKTERLHLPVKSGEETLIFDCAKTNARFIAEEIGDSETQSWVGKKLLFETYKTKTSEGEMVDAINVKEVQ